MSKPDLLMPIEAGQLSTVTGGKHGGDALINDLKYLATSIKDLQKQTSGFDSSSLLLLCCLALQRNNNHANTNVVYVQRGPFRW